MRASFKTYQPKIFYHFVYRCSALFNCFIRLVFCAYHAWSLSNQAKQWNAFRRQKKMVFLHFHHHHYRSVQCNRCTVFFSSLLQWNLGTLKTMTISRRHGDQFSQWNFDNMHDDRDAERILNCFCLFFFVVVLTAISGEAKHLEKLKERFRYI